MKLTSEQETKSFLVYKEAETGARIDVQKSQLERAVKELVNWQMRPEATNFSVQLFNLICKADIENKKKLLTGFPARMIAYLLWMEAPDKEEFYEKFMSLTESEAENEQEQYC